MPEPTGSLVTLTAPSPLTGNPPGICLRRWDGEIVGAAAGVPATLAGIDAGITFTAHPGNYLVGEWWGIRVRGSATEAAAAETLTNAPPDGVIHATAALAVVDLATGTVLTDCRRMFPPLVEIRGGTCTVVALPGDNLQTALDALPNDGGVLCLAAGTYPVDVPLKLTGKRRVMIKGVGPSTVLAGQGHEAVLIATACDDLEVRDLRLEAALPKAPPSPHLQGALTVRGGEGLRVRDCQFWCPDSRGRAQSCLYIDPDPKGGRPGHVEIRGNRLEVGDQQVGILIISARETTVIDNDLRLAPLRRGGGGVNRAMATELGRHVARHLLATGNTRRLNITTPGMGAVRIGGPLSIRDVATDWARHAARGTPVVRPARALARFVTASATEAHRARVSPSTAAFLAAAVQRVRTIGQGIVVAGDRAPRVRIEGNDVTGVLQGIHVGLQERDPKKPAAAGQVVISGNTVLCLVPFFWGRQRHAFYVGNVNRLTMLDNHAALVRSGGDTDGTAVDAVRIWGQLGPWLQLRGLEVTGTFRFGVVLRDTNASPGTTLHYISDVANLNGVKALDVPPSPTVLRDRCLP